MENRKVSIISPQFVLGMLIIAVGVVFMLDNFDIISAGDFLRYWPALLIVWGISKVSQSHGSPGKTFGWILIVIGSLMLLDRLEFIAFHLHDWWPLILIIIGLNFLRGSWMRSRTKGADDSPWVSKGLDSEQFIKHIAIMSGVRRQVTSKDFRGGELTAIMGGCEIDLREADIKGEEAVIDVVAIWGGIEIRVPMGWSVSVKAMPIMGGVDDKTYPSKEGERKRLVLTGNIVMGGVEIKN
jgi:predicted membrane protein